MVISQNQCDMEPIDRRKKVSKNEESVKKKKKKGGGGPHVSHFVRRQQLHRYYL